MARKKKPPSLPMTKSSMQREIEKAPVPVSRETCAYVRLAHPTEFGKYYNRHDAINPWVERHYSRWSRDEWEGVFGKGYDEGTDSRKWEFFGYTIPLYDDPKT